MNRSELPTDETASDWVARESSPNDDPAVERALRPRSFEEYVGQEQATRNLRVFIQAARERGEALDHVLLSGPPGLGKTTLAHLISGAMGGQLHIIAAPNLERKGDLAALLTNLKRGDVLFIDEVHRLFRPIEELLYSAMEDYRLDVVVGQGPQARTIRLELEPFTLVGATTRSGLLSSPLRDRFGVALRLEFYTSAELERILHRSSSLLGIALVDSGAHELARRSRGTPRVANRLLKRVRDFAQVELRATQIDGDAARQALALLDVDERGLDAMDRRILRTLVERFDGGPVGIEALSFALGENRETVEEAYEPYLVQEAYILRTPRGRVAGGLAYDALGLPRPMREGAAPSVASDEAFAPPPGRS